MTRKPKPTKIDLSAWAVRVGAQLVDPDPERPEYVVKTRIGSLTVRPISANTGGAWIACRFEDVDAATRHFHVKGWDHRLNPYSGKWNFNEGLGLPGAVPYMLKVFESEVEKLLGGSPCP